MKEKSLRIPPAFPGMTIGLFGGTFDPPHEGHRLVAETAIQRLGLDQLWWMVTPGNPLKDRADMTRFEKRLETSREFARHPRIIVTGFEARLNSAYTADTIAHLVNRYSATRFIWLMGADNLHTFHRWQLWREIFMTVPVAIADRPGFRHRALAARAASFFAKYRVDDSDASGLKRYRAPAWTFLTSPVSELSSTQLRLEKNNKR